MEDLISRFGVHFNDIYGKNDDAFVEKMGRKLFLLYLKPIINGIGNYYIEAQTRDETRTDVVIDYLGRQYIIELKIWRGNAYNERGEEQIAGYLDYFLTKKGYLVSFCFNKCKSLQTRMIQVGDKTVFEAVVQGLRLVGYAFYQRCHYCLVQGPLNQHISIQYLPK